MPKVMEVEDWNVVFDRLDNPSPIKLCLTILQHLDGYGTEYGFDEKIDAESLVNAATSLGRRLIARRPL